MSLERNIKIKCSHCKKEFDITIFDSINIQLNPEMKEKIFDGSIYYFECPHCHKIETVVYPFLYHDMEKKFMVRMDEMAQLIAYTEEMKKARAKADKQLVKVMDEVNETVMGVTNLHELMSIITLYDFGLDVKIGKIYQDCEKDLFNMNEQNVENGKYMIGSFFDKDENGELILNCLGIEGNKKFEFSSSFDEYLYNDLMEEYYLTVSTINPFVFNYKTVDKIIRKKSNEEFEKYKNIDVRVALVDGADFTNEIVYVPTYKKVKEGDTVVLDGGGFRTGVVKKIYTMNYFSLPFYEDDLLKILWVLNDDYKENSDIDLKQNNKKFFTNFDKESWDTPYDDIKYSKVIICSKPSKGEKIKPTKEGFSVLADLATTKTDKGELLNVYLDEKDIEDETYIPLNQNYRSLIKMLILARFNGINVIVDGKEYQIVLDYLVYHIYDQIINDRQKMKEVLIDMPKVELDYIGQDVYDLLFTETLEGKRFDVLNDEIKKTNKKDMLGKFQSLITANYFVKYL